MQGGRYRIKRVLGQGGFGITYEAEQPLLRRIVAIKEFFMKDCCDRDSATSKVTIGTGNQKDLAEKFRGKFIREAQVIAGMEHPHIVRVTDVFEENGTAYYVMENLTGGSLADKVKKEGPFSEAKAEKYIRQVSAALAYIHSRNTVHLDIKPSNILLNSEGDAVLIDFGISKHYDDSGEQTSSTPVGQSKGYAPLEQSLDGDVSQFKPSTDIYSLGATFYYLITGLTPPEATIVNEDGLKRPKEVSDRIWDAIEIAMKPRRKERPQSVDAFLSYLNDNTSLDKQRINNQDEERTIIRKLNPSQSPSRGSFKIKHDIEIKNKGNIIRLLKWIVPVLAILIASIIIPWKDLVSSTKHNNALLTPSHEDIITIEGVKSFHYYVEADGGTKQCSISRNFEEGWEYYQKPDWCTLYTGSSLLTIVCQKNTTNQERIAEIIFKKKGEATGLASIVVTQAAAKETKSQSNSSNTDTIVQREMTLSHAELSMFVGQSFTLSATNYGPSISWESEYPTVASVSSTGKITALRPGRTVITAKGSSEKRCVVTVSVRSTTNPSSPSNNEMTLSPTSLSLRVGQSFTLSATNYGASLSWESDNTKVATVSSTGKVIAIGPGKTNIWAKGKELKRCLVTVESGSASVQTTKATTTNKTNVERSDSMTISTERATLRIGESITLIVTNYGPSLKWESDNPKIATVDSNGKVTAISAGQTRIWAKGYIYRSCLITVEKRY